AKLLERTNGSTGQLNVGQLEKAGAGTMQITGTNSLRGTNLISGGTLRAGTAQSFGLNAALVLSNALGVTADFNGFNQTIGSLAGGGASGGTVLLGTNNMTLGTANANTSFGGLIDGSGSVIKVGTGTQTLTSANTYSGGTFLNAGGITGGLGLGNVDQPGGFECEWHRRHRGQQPDDERSDFRHGQPDQAGERGAEPAWHQHLHRREQSARRHAGAGQQPGDFRQHGDGGLQLHGVGARQPEPLQRGHPEQRPDRFGGHGRV
ncbi:MAG: hypothetical protein EBV89_11380, partial [Betaproteobacteria bacterium]|nr:hypothetical protein [Betaproteobacteria bacterium]